MYKSFLVFLLVLISVFLFFAPSIQAQETGTLQVFSEEPGAFIYIDSFLKAKDTYITKDLQVGEHYLKVVKESTNDVLFSEVIKIVPKEVRTILVPPLKKKAPIPETVSPTPEAAKPAPPLKKIIKIPTLPLLLTEFTPALREKRIAAVDAKGSGGIKGFRENQELKQILAGIKGLSVEKADVAGLKAGELVLKINGLALDTVPNYKKLEASLAIDSPAVFEVFGEDNKIRNVEIKVGSIEKEEIIETPPEEVKTAPQEVGTPEGTVKEPIQEEVKEETAPEKAVPDANY